jgi:hypothetical protein
MYDAQWPLLRSSLALLEAAQGASDTTTPFDHHPGKGQAPNHKKPVPLTVKANSLTRSPVPALHTHRDLLSCVRTGEWDLLLAWGIPEEAEKSG